MNPGPTQEFNVKHLEKCYSKTNSYQASPMKNETKIILRTVFYAYIALAVVATFGYMLVENDQHAEQAKSSEVTSKEAENIKYVVPGEIVYLYGDALLQRLKAGGLVVYFRHFATDHRQVPNDETVQKHADITADELMTTCDIQRPLSDYGRLQAKIVREGILKNSIPVGRVLSSPYCRAAEGAEIAFGKKPETHRDLIYATNKYPVESMSSHINSLLGEQPEVGNTFVMAHKTQMNDISKIAEGEAYVFEPLGDSSYNLIGRIGADEWFLASFNPAALAGFHLQQDVYSKKSE